MQINEGTLADCAKEGQTKEYVRNRMMSGDTAYSVWCGLKIYRQNGKHCQSWEAKLCAYNTGGGYCRGYKDKEGVRHPPRPNEPCAYSQEACNKTGTNCQTVQMGNNPYTGVPNIGVYKAPNGLSNVTTPHVPLNCPNLAIAQAMDQARRLYRANMLTTTMDTYKQALEYDWKNADKVKGCAAIEASIA